jgi:hypothetical protein
LRWDEERGRLLAAYETALGSKVSTATRPLAMPAHD